MDSKTTKIFHPIFVKLYCHELRIISRKRQHFRCIYAIYVIQKGSMSVVMQCIIFAHWLVSLFSPIKARCPLLNNNIWSDCTCMEFSMISYYSRFWIFPSICDCQRVTDKVLQFWIVFPPYLQSYTVRRELLYTPLLSSERVTHN